MIMVEKVGMDTYIFSRGIIESLLCSRDIEVSLNQSFGYFLKTKAHFNNPFWENLVLGKYLLLVLSICQQINGNYPDF